MLKPVLKHCNYISIEFQTDITVTQWIQTNSLGC